jgi:basic membrane protein A
MGKTDPLAPDLLRSKEFARHPTAWRLKRDSTMQMTRRGFLGGVGGAALAFGSVSSARAANTTIGFIYVGSKDDYGWNQSHAVAASALKDIPGITVVEEENVPETDAVSKTWSR